MSNSALTLCTSCFEAKSLQDFPRDKLTPNCSHHPTVCVTCVGTFLETQSVNGLMDQLSCPECPERLTYDRIQDLAGADVFERYRKHSIDQLAATLNNFVWCPLGCGTRVESTGAQNGITLCLSCNLQFCARHQVPWHVDYTCDEYDIFLTNQNFLTRKLQERKRWEEDQTAARFPRLTKPCPGCRIPTEKNRGW
ncbi:hypothetical protein F4678DRAFT_471029 [Xylaria arbuscula]|nr:hypothetical protein F4678DRAFT_471029 [Xylaria arbuscula]